MKQQSTAPKATTTGTSSATAAGPAKTPTSTPAQDRVGNQALASSIKGAGPEKSALLDTEEDGGVTAPVEDGISRPSKLKKGLHGALIGGGSDITLTADAGKGATVATVKDGVAAKVEQYNAAHVKVSVRQGQSTVKGWVAVQLFSDQPALANDEDSPGMRQDLEYNLMEGDLSPSGQPDRKTPTTQGGLGDCYLIASMAALHFANPDFAKRLVQYDAKRKKYIVTFYQNPGTKSMKPVPIEVDGYLPMEKGVENDPAYAGDSNDALWGAIVEKAYAKWKGGYDQIEGGDGGQAMAEMTGVKSAPKNPASMKEADVVPYFKNAQSKGLAIYAGVINSIAQAKQTPLSGSASGPFTGAVSQPHSWNEIQRGSVRVVDASGKVGTATDVGADDEDKAHALAGGSVKSGEVSYKDSRIQIEYLKGKAPKSAKDLEVHFETHGVVLPSKMLIGNHAYAFSGVVNGNELQFYNPWGSYQPKPITAAEFLQYFDSLSTNQVPATKTGGS